MIRFPRIGDTVRAHYATKPKRKGLPAPSTFMPWHGKVGTIAVIAWGKIRNIGVRFDCGNLIVIPAGNLVRVEA